MEVIYQFMDIPIAMFFCFMTGLFVKMRIGSMIRQWLEGVLLKRLPGYTMFKNLTKRIAGEGGIEFAPALVDLYGSEARALGFIIEQQGEGSLTVFVPISPMPTLGQVFLVPETHVQNLEAKFVDVVNSLTQWGMESNKFLRRSQDELYRQSGSRYVFRNRGLWPRCASPRHGLFQG
jgi:uncharacterized membrane protein